MPSTDANERQSIVGGELAQDSKLAAIISFIQSGYLYSAPSGNLLRGALSPATVKEKCLKKLAERRHIVPRQQAQCKREFIPSGGVNNRESSTRFKRVIRTYYPPHRTHPT